MRKLISTIITLSMAAAVLPIIPQAEKVTANAADATLSETATDTEDTTVTATGEAYADVPDTLGFTDPQLITDETFFGKYENGSWTSAGYFNYDAYSGLADVKTAVMNGDYTTAKSLVTTYYKNKAATYKISTSGTTTKLYRLMADLAAEKMAINEASSSAVIDIAKFTATPAEVSVDVTGDIGTCLSGNVKKLSVAMVGVKKDGSSVSINSKESGTNVPTLEVVTGGVTKTYTASKDTYISSGANKSTNYGSQSDVKVCESTSSIGTTLATDANTYRGWLQFDFDDIDLNATITSATMKLYGSNTGTTGDAYVALFHTSDTTWSETALKWSSYSHYIYSYYGEDGMNYLNRPSDANSRYKEDILRYEGGPRKIFNRYFHTDHQDYYAYHALTEFGHFITTTGSNPGYEHELDVSCRCALFNDIFNMMDSKYMSSDFFVTVLKYYWSVEEQMYGHWTNQEEKTNWGTVQVAAEYNLYSKMYEFTAADKWLNQPANTSSTIGAGPNSGINARLADQIGSLVQADGSGLECAMGYVAMAVNNCMSINYTAAEANLTSPFSDSVKESLRSLARYLMLDSMPGYRDNQVGNTSTYNTNYKYLMNSVGNLVGDEELKYAGSDGKNGTKTTELSHIWTTAKRAVMRTGWDDNDLYLHINCDGGQGSHGHHDDLSLSIWGKGGYLVADPLYYSYTSSDYDQFLVNTKGHNSVEVDNTTEKGNGFYLTNEVKGGVLGNMDRWETNSSYDFITAQTLNYDYINVRPQRSVLFVRPGFWIVSDYLLPLNSDTTTAHVYKQRWHFEPNSGLTVDSTTKTTDTNKEKANIKIVPIAPDELTTATVMTDGYYHGANQADYILYSKENVAGPQTFNTILYPESIGETLNIANMTKISMSDVTDNGAQAFSFETTDNGTTTDSTYYIVNNTSEKSSRAVGSYATDGAMFYHETNSDGTFKSAFLQSGTTLEKNGTKLLYATSSQNNVGVRYSGSTIYIDGSDLTADSIKNITIRKNASVTSVMLNNTAVSFSQSDNYVYFADAPIIDETKATPVPTATVVPTATPEPTATAVPTASPSPTPGIVSTDGNMYLINDDFSDTTRFNSTKDVTDTGHYSISGVANGLMNMNLENSMLDISTSSSTAGGIMNINFGRTVNGVNTGHQGTVWLEYKMTMGTAYKQTMIEPWGFNDTGGLNNRILTTYLNSGSSGVYGSTSTALANSSGSAAYVGAATSALTDIAYKFKLNTSTSRVEAMYKKINSASDWTEVSLTDGTNNCFRTSGTNAGMLRIYFNASSGSPAAGTHWGINYVKAWYDMSGFDSITFDTIKNANTTADDVESNLSLTSSITQCGLTVPITWKSTDPGIIAADGTVTRGNYTRVITLTPVYTFDGINIKGTAITVTVPKASSSTKYAINDTISDYSDISALLATGRYSFGGSTDSATTDVAALRIEDGALIYKRNSTLMGSILNITIDSAGLSGQYYVEYKIKPLGSSSIQTRCEMRSSTSGVIDSQQLNNKMAVSTSKSTAGGTADWGSTSAFSADSDGYYDMKFLIDTTKQYITSVWCNDTDKTSSYRANSTAGYFRSAAATNLSSLVLYNNASTSSTGTDLYAIKSVKAWKATSGDFIAYETSISETDTANHVYSVAYTTENTNETTGTAYIAMYDAGGKLVGMTSAAITTGTNANTAAITASADAVTCKIFFWQSGQSAVYDIVKTTL